MRNGVFYMHRSEYDRLYRIWKAMRTRCNNPHFKLYYRYGGRGIRVCKEWENFDSFQSWAYKNGYNDSLTIDRINNDGNYSPENCKWSSLAEQQQTRSSCHMITYNGKTQNLTRWASEYHMPRERLKRRLELGWSFEKAVKEVV